VGYYRPSLWDSVSRSRSSSTENSEEPFLWQSLFRRLPFRVFLYFVVMYLHFSAALAFLDHLHHGIADIRELCGLQLTDESRHKAGMGGEQLAGTRVAG